MNVNFRPTLAIRSIEETLIQNNKNVTNRVIERSIFKRRDKLILYTIRIVR